GLSAQFPNHVEPGPEINSQPAQGVALQPGPQEPYDPLSIKARGSCESIKARILEFSLIQDELEEVEKSFPGITKRLTPSQAIDLLMKKIITSEQGIRGIEEGATHRDIICYKWWLSRVMRGTDPKFPLEGSQGHIHDIDIYGKIFALYHEYCSNGGDPSGAFYPVFLRI
ncbi:hypothetical protein FRX31_008425, partial [Thalictrum thalictroides]